MTISTGPNLPIAATLFAIVFAATDPNDAAQKFARADGERGGFAEVPRRAGRPAAAVHPGDGDAAGYPSPIQVAVGLGPISVGAAGSASLRTVPTTKTMLPERCSPTARRSV